MASLQNEKVIKTIQNTLKDDEELRKLLFYNEPEALELETPKIKDIINKIYTFPLITEDNEVTSFVAINLDRCKKEGTNLINILKISCVCHNSIWDLTEGRLRVFRMMDRVEKLIDNQKFESAGKLNLRDIAQIYYTPKLVGYVMIFSFVDSDGKVDNEDVDVPFYIEEQPEITDLEF